MNVKRLKRLCPICKNDEGKNLGNVKMALGESIKLPKHYDIVACNECGFTFADTESVQEDYNEYYESDNCYVYDGEIKSSGMQQSIRSTTHFFEKYAQKDESIIDLGCGSGEFLIALKEKGYKNLCGLDPSQASIDRLINAGIKGIKKNIFDVWGEDEAYDIIVSTCVMEHICDLEGFLNIALSHLKENGKIFIVVPAVEGFEKYYQSKANYFNHEHINYFSKLSLTNLLGIHGCKSLNEDNGEYYIIENSSRIKDLMLQNIFCYDKKVNYRKVRDELSEKSVSNYIQKNKEEEQKVLKILNELVEKKCIVWGAGSLSMQLMSDEKFAEKVAFFVDNNKEKTGKDIAGKKIFSPEVLEEEQNKDFVLLVVCMQYKDDIIQQIKNMKIKNHVLVY